MFGREFSEEKRENLARKMLQNCPKFLFIFIFIFYWEIWGFGGIYRPFVTL